MPNRKNDGSTDDVEYTDNGVLEDTGDVDTSIIGVIGTQTSQINVSFPSNDDTSDDDVDDDEVIQGEVVPDDVADEDDVVLEAELEGNVVLDENPEGDDAANEIAPANEVYVDEVHVDEVHVDDVEHEDGNGDVDDIEVDAGNADQVVGTDAHGDETAADEIQDDEMHDEAPQNQSPQSASSVEAIARPAEQPAPMARARTRRSAEVTLASKRLGDLSDSSRESADLLTADRLLDPNQVARPEPEGGWTRFIYAISGKRINLGDSKRVRDRKALTGRISAPLLGGARFVPVLSRKGGVGKTTITTLLGMALADARDDRVIAVDANPDRGTLAERIARPSGKTVRDLVNAKDKIVGYNDVSNIVARDETRLDVLASDADPHMSEAFNDLDYREVAAVAAHYYSIVLTDTGTGIVHSVMGATLELADQIIVVSGLSIDGARLASDTLTWLETNGYSDQARNAIVVLNQSGPGQPMVRLEEVETHFRSRVSDVVRMPYDPLIATGGAITFSDLQPATRLAARELAAKIVEGLRTLPHAA